MLDAQPSLKAHKKHENKIAATQNFQIYNLKIQKKTLDLCLQLLSKWLKADIKSIEKLVCLNLGKLSTLLFSVLFVRLLLLTN